jgi:hypothetical protein
MTAKMYTEQLETLGCRNQPELRRDWPCYFGRRELSLCLSSAPPKGLRATLVRRTLTGV